MFGSERKSSDPDTANLHGSFGSGITNLATETYFNIPITVVINVRF